MLTSEAIQTIKRTNVSADTELTKTRAKEILKGATNAQKNEIDALAGLKRVSINRTYETGTISAKIAVAIAQTLGIDPFYLTGEVSEKGELTEEVLNKFLEAKGYAELVTKTEAEKPARKQRKKATAKEKAVPATVSVEPSAPAAAPAKALVETFAPVKIPIEPPVEVKPAKGMEPISQMSEEEVVQLIQSLFMRARYSGNALSKLNQIKELLV